MLVDGDGYGQEGDTDRNGKDGSRRADVLQQEAGEGLADSSIALSGAVRRGWRTAPIVPASAVVAPGRPSRSRRCSVSVSRILVGGRRSSRGSEFKADFETYCQQHDRRLFVLPPRSSKRGGRVERPQPTFDEECYQRLDVPVRVPDLAAGIHAYEEVSNQVRPHHALGYLTPQQYLGQPQEAA